MGSLSEDEKVSYESLLETDKATRELVSEISDDWSSLALLSKPASLDPEMRARTLMTVHPPPDLSIFLKTDEVDRLRENYSKPSTRYLGGDGTVDSSEVKDVTLKDG